MMIARFIDKALSLQRHREHGEADDLTGGSSGNGVGLTKEIASNVFTDSCLFAT
jgi:hypothetical protein